MKLIILILVLSSLHFCQDLRFIREDITFNLDAANFNVEGYYWFLNPSSSKELQKIIYYPLPELEKDSTVDSIDVLDISAKQHLNILNRSEKGFYFYVNIGPGETAAYRIKYRQKALSDSAMYILRSTKTWGDPLESAEYKLIIDPKIEITGFAYIPDKEYTIDNKKIYYWKKTRFMPEQDMIFYFKRK